MLCHHCFCFHIFFDAVVAYSQPSINCKTRDGVTQFFKDHRTHMWGWAAGVTALVSMSQSKGMHVRLCGGVCNNSEWSFGRYIPSLNRTSPAPWQLLNASGGARVCVDGVGNPRVPGSCLLQLVDCRTARNFSFVREFSGGGGPRIVATPGVGGDRDSPLCLDANYGTKGTGQLQLFRCNHVVGGAQDFVLTGLSSASKGVTVAERFTASPFDCAELAAPSCSPPNLR